MIITYDYKNTGIDEAKIRSYQDKIEKADNALKEKRRAGELGFMELPYQDTKKLLNYIRDVRTKYKNFVLLGIGGSALGNIAIHQALNHPYYNILPAEKRKNSPRMFFMDNIDPDLFYSMLETIDIKKTLFNVVTKSGSTPETISQFMIIFNIISKKGNLKKNLVITTDKEKGFLRTIVNKYNLDSFEVPGNVGGRFSVLSPVGLLSAGISGISIPRLLKGAEQMDKICSNSDIFKNPAYLNSLIHYIADKDYGKSISVMMPYSNSLYGLADWYRQLWAESLGKEKDRDGNIINCGQTPIKALGATDQHSQIQLYKEGPNNKIITFLMVEKYNKEVRIPKVFKENRDLDFIRGKSLNKLINAELLATETALKNSNRMSCRIIFPKICEETVGQFIYMFEVQTAFSGELYNINAFDQPGVEEGKILTKKLLSTS